MTVHLVQCNTELECWQAPLFWFMGIGAAGSAGWHRGRLLARCWKMLKCKPLQTHYTKRSVESIMNSMHWLNYAINHVSAGNCFPELKQRGSRKNNSTSLNYWIYLPSMCYVIAIEGNLWQSPPTKTKEKAHIPHLPFVIIAVGIREHQLADSVAKTSFLMTKSNTDPCISLNFLLILSNGGLVFCLTTEAELHPSKSAEGIGLRRVTLCTMKHTPLKVKPIS